MSIKKVSYAIVVILLLMHLDSIIRMVFRPIYFWIHDSLSVVRHYNKDFQALLGIITLLSICYLILRIFNR